MCVLRMCATPVGIAQCTLRHPAYFSKRSSSSLCGCSASLSRGVSNTYLPPLCLIARGALNVTAIACNVQEGMQAVVRYNRLELLCLKYIPDSTSHLFRRSAL